MHSRNADVGRQSDGSYRTNRLLKKSLVERKYREQGKDKNGHYRRNVALLQSFAEHKRDILCRRAEDIQSGKISFEITEESHYEFRRRLVYEIRRVQGVHDKIRRMEIITSVFEFLSDEENYAMIIYMKPLFKEVCSNFQRNYQAVSEDYPTEKYRFVPYVDMFRYDVKLKFAKKKPVCLQTLENKECIICYESVVTCQTNCLHNYCESCILKHFERHSDCPYCRTPLTEFTKIV